MNYYIFRIDYSKRDYFKENLEKGLLRQGWGMENLSLVNENGEARNQEEWVNACPENWRTTEEARKYLRNKNTNLKKMLEMKEGDIILIPKFPEWNMFSLYKVTGKYYFNLEETAVDYGHCILVKIATIYPDEVDKYFTYNGNIATKINHSKLRGYQTAINSVYNRDVTSLLQTISIKGLASIFLRFGTKLAIFSIKPRFRLILIKLFYTKRGFFILFSFLFSKVYNSKPL